MDIVLIFNGLGNQMSQYAFYLSKKQNNAHTQLLYFPNEHDNQHNGFELEKIFGIKISKNLKQYFFTTIYRLYLNRYKKDILGKLTRKILRCFDVKVIYEDFKTYQFNPLYLSKSNGLTFYYGGWHNQKYFNEIKEEITSLFYFKIDKKDKLIINLAKEIRSKNSISIHVRRGDYLSMELKKIFGNICTINYYKKAIKYIQEKVDNPFFYIFSDDKEWVKENFKIPNSYIIDNNTGEHSWKDMYLMSICSHNINANSTFSWWGAWLNKNEDKIVVVPEKFYFQDELKDFYPETWIKISV